MQRTSTIDLPYRQLEWEAGISCLQQVSVRYQTELNLFTCKFLDKGIYNPQQDIDKVNIKKKPILNTKEVQWKTNSGIH